MLYRLYRAQIKLHAWLTITEVQNSFIGVSVKPFHMGCHSRWITYSVESNSSGSPSQWITFASGSNSRWITFTVAHIPVAHLQSGSHLYTYMWRISSLSIICIICSGSKLQNINLYLTLSAEFCTIHHSHLAVVDFHFVSVFGVMLLL